MGRGAIPSESLQWWIGYMFSSSRGGGRRGIVRRSPLTTSSDSSSIMNYSQGYNSLESTLLAEGGGGGRGTAGAAAARPRETKNSVEPVSNTNTTTTTSSSSSSSCEMKASEFERLRQLPGNSQCVDCSTPNPDWGSPSLGILFCFQCSGVHRGLGVHISFVRSVRMDSWTPGQLELMRLGGNDRCNHFLHSHGVTETTIVGVGDETDPHNTTTTKNSNEPNKALLQNRNTKNKTATNNNNTMTSRAHAVIRNKYDSGAAALYKQVLIAERDGLPIPTTVPNNVTSEPIKSQPGGQKKMEGFGSTPLLEARRTDAHWMTKRLMYIAIPAVVGAAVWMLVPH